MAINTLARLGRLLSSALLFLGLLNCENKKSILTWVANADTLRLVNKGPLKYYNKHPYTGTVFKLDSLSGDSLFTENYLLGSKHGIFKRFYPNNQLFEERSYRKGKKEGLHLGYWENGNLAFEYHLENDEYHGSLKAWNPSGQIIKFLNYERGQEAGRQQLWYDDGAVRTNYIIKDNRRYGLLGTKNCTNVSDSIQ